MAKEKDAKESTSRNSERGIQWKGVLVGAFATAILVFASTIVLLLLERDWTKESLANAFIGEISAIIEHRNTEYLESILSELYNEKVWKPFDQPAVENFIIYTENADELGLLGPELSRKIAGFYFVEYILVEKERVFGDGRYFKLEDKDKKVWLEGYIKLQKRATQNGRNLVHDLEGVRSWFPF